MKAKNVTQNEMELAMSKINNKYNGNVEWNRFDGSRVFNFTLKVKDSSGLGAKFGFTTNKDGEYRKTCSACWHVHGDFFDALIEINQDAVIVSSFAKIDKNGGNWQDRNIGSMFNPRYYSESCNCD